MLRSPEKIECNGCFDLVNEDDMAPTCADLCWSCWEQLGVAEQQFYIEKEEGKPHASA